MWIYNTKEIQQGTWILEKWYKNPLGFQNWFSFLRQKVGIWFILFQRNSLEWPKVSLGFLTYYPYPLTIINFSIKQGMILGLQLQKDKKKKKKSEYWLKAKMALKSKKWKKCFRFKLGRPILFIFCSGPSSMGKINKNSERARGPRAHSISNIPLSINIKDPPSPRFSCRPDPTAPIEISFPTWSNGSYFQKHKKKASFLLNISLKQKQNFVFFERNPKKSFPLCFFPYNHESNETFRRVWLHPRHERHGREYP